MVRCILVLTVTLGAAGCTGAGTAVSDPAAAQAALFPLSQVRLLDGPFKHTQDVNLTYLRALEPDRLLAAYRTEAGLQPRAAKYPNWESSGLEGHTAGHYLTALAQAWAATGDPEMKRRLDYMVDELAACQRAHRDGYVGAIPGGRQLWTEIGSGDIRAEPFSLNGKWVPWYNLHKLFAGLRDAHVVGGSAQALDVLVRLTAWADALVAPLTDAQVQDMLQSEHGGLNEVFADVAALTGESKYLTLASRFSHRALLEPLRREEDTLTGLHANTQIPKVVGYARIAELGGDGGDLPAARFFWDTVVDRRTVAFGGNSVREHFNRPGDFEEMLASREGPETCNTYNMLRLTEALFRAEPSAAFADYYERALFNHILSSQHPEHGGFVYFTPIRPRHYRVYSQPSQCFWCCVGSGMESHGKSGQFIYARDDEGLFVNLFIASVLEWRERGLTIRQETGFPDEASTRLVVSTAAPQRFTLRLRHPVWVADGAFQVRVNDRPLAPESRPSSFAVIEREWRDGDVIEVELPMRTAIEPLSDSGYVAILHGPLVLAAKTGDQDLDGLIADDDRWAHIASGRELPLEEAPRLAGDVGTIAAAVRPVPGRPLTFTAREILRPAPARDLQLVPFFRVHDSRYVIYWRVEPER